MRAMTGTPIAADQRGQAGRGQDFATSRCGGFAVGAGNGQDFALEEAGGEFQLTDEGKPNFYCASSGVLSGHQG